MKILIVDDNPIDRKLLRLNLERHGCEDIIEARDGREGYDMASRHRPDLIISDALMPGVDGFELLRKLKTGDELKGIPFLFHSAVYTGMKEKELALSMGAEAFIVKPKEPDEFWKELCDILERCESGREKPLITEPVGEEKEYLRKYSGMVAAKLEEKVKELEKTLEERKQAEEALLASELQRCRLQAELTCAAQVQAKLLPVAYPDLPNFELAARCIPAHQLGGDFYDWLEVSPGVIALTLGDVMGNGMSAAMLMTTARSAVHTAALQNRPAAAVQLAERALSPDLESSESFVTLFHAQLNVHTGAMTYVDCGHGYAFMRRSDGTFEELVPGGPPLGVPNMEPYQEGTLAFAKGDTLVMYTDGLIDARPELALTGRILAEHVDSASARNIMHALLALPELEGPPSDDLTVLVIRCNSDLSQA